MAKRAISVQLQPDLNDLLREALFEQTIELNICVSQMDARCAMLKENYCLVVIDTSKLEPEIAREHIRNFRLNTYAPIISINALEATSQILDAGADISFQDSVPLDIVISHAMALLRRYTLYNLYDDLKPDDAVLYRGALMIDPIRHRVVLGNEEIHLQPREFRLLLHFARNPGIVVTPDRVCETVWQNSYERNRDITAVIAELRRKLGDLRECPVYIETVHGFGYRFLPLA